MTILEKTNTSWQSNPKVKRLVKLLGSCFYIGYAGKFPSTLVSLPGILLFFLTKDLSLWIQGLTLVIFIMIAIGIVQLMEEMDDKSDPVEIVIDETIGMWVALFALYEPTFTIILVAFLLYRALDQLKPFPISIFQTIKGGKGVVADDIATGMVVNIIIRLLILKGVF